MAHFLTFNTHLFGNTLLDVAPIKWCHHRIYKDGERLAEMVQTILAQKPDHLALMEVWSPDTRQAVADVFGAAGYCVYSEPGKRFWQTSGLMLLSRYPIRQQSFTPFHRAGGYERLVKKGWVHAELITPSGQALHILTTHVQSHTSPSNARVRRQHFQQIISDIHRIQAQDPGALIVVTGDFNLDENSADYTEVNAQFEAVGLTDAYRKQHPVKADNPGYTFDRQHNRLPAVFNPKKRKSTTAKRLDYFYTNFEDIRDVSVQAFKTRAQEDLSDHYALSMVAAVE